MENKKIVGNASWIIACKLIKAVLTFLVTMITARCLGPGNYGLISYAAGVVAFVAPIMKLGFDSILVHELVNSPENEGKTLGTAIVLNLISAIVCIVGVFVFVVFTNAGEKEAIIVCTLYSMMLIFQGLEMIQYWFQSKLMSKYTSVSMMISYVCVAVFQVIILLTNKNIYLYSLSNSIDFLIISIMLFLAYKKLGGKKLEISVELGKKMLNKSKFYIISGLMVMVFSQTDKIMIKNMIGNEATGFYSAAATCAGMTSFVFAAIMDSVRPVVFEGKKVGQEHFENILCKVYSVIIYSSLAVSFFITIFSPIIIRIMYGTVYDPSINVLRISVWFTTFSYLGTVRDMWILAEGKQKYIWRINLCGALMNIFLNFVLIPFIGINGAAVASLLTQFFTNVILGDILRPIRPNNKIMRKSFGIKYFISVIKYVLG